MAPSRLPSLDYRPAEVLYSPELAAPPKLPRPLGADRPGRLPRGSDAGLSAGTALPGAVRGGDLAQRRPAPPRRAAAATGRRPQAPRPDRPRHRQPHRPAHAGSPG